PGLYPLSLHDALPILAVAMAGHDDLAAIERLILIECRGLVALIFAQQTSNNARAIGVQFVVETMPVQRADAGFHVRQSSHFFEADRKSTRLNSSHVKS